MKIYLTLAYLLLNMAAGFSQTNIIRHIAEVNPQEVALAPLRYLASDELRGRGYDQPEINIAAQYIGDQFKQFGLKTVAGAQGYFQPFTLKVLTPGTTGSVTIGNMHFTLGSDALQQQAADVNIHAPVVYVGHAAIGQLSTMDIKGKVVLMDMGSGDNKPVGFTDVMEIPSLLSALEKKGAKGLIERVGSNDRLWGELKGFFSTPHLQDPLQTSSLTAIIIKSTDSLQAELAKNFTANCSITVSGTTAREVALKNVIGFVQGTDTKLRNQYILLTAHYDHLGVAESPKMEEGKLDSIYNGARDNASGTTAVIDAARYFAKYPPKRSVLFITYTAEEQGLIGSSWYAAHPLVPLKQTVFNLNIDNASYNDTSLITFVGLGRTTADSAVVQACRAYGMHVNNDPLGGELFAGSDNYPLANMGVPAPTYSLGMKTFDSTITNRYHQLSDEVGNMDMAYVMRFIKAYILAADNIANNPTPPHWTKGDPLEKEWMKLYQ